MLQEKLRFERKSVCVEWDLFFLIPKMSGKMKLGKEMPAKATHHLNSQKGNGWKAQNKMWESIRNGKCTIAVFGPDMFEKLKLTISSAILFKWGKTWFWDWPAEKGRRALVLLGIFVTALCWEGGFPPFLQRWLSSWWPYLPLWPWSPLENSNGRSGKNDHKIQWKSLMSWRWWWRE